MSKNSLCIGRRSVQPFFVRHLNNRIYSMEELCYDICENASMLDKDFMNEELIDYIDVECGMKKLSTELRELLHFGGSLHSFCGLILQAAAYCPKEEIKRVEEILSKNENLSAGMRMKNRADYMMQKAKYLKAFEAYEKLYQTIAQEEEELKPLLLFNMGTANARMFFFEKAAEYYQKAYEMGKDTRARRAYLTCLRFSMSKEEYVDYMTSHPEDYEMALDIEQNMEKMEHEYQKAVEPVILQSENLLTDWKDEFRQIALG